MNRPRIACQRATTAILGTPYATGPFSVRSQCIKNVVRFLFPNSRHMGSHSTTCGIVGMSHATGPLYGRAQYAAHVVRCCVIELQERLLRSSIILKSGDVSRDGAIFSCDSPCTRMLFGALGWAALALDASEKQRQLQGRLTRRAHVMSVHCSCVQLAMLKLSGVADTCNSSRNPRI